VVKADGLAAGKGAIICQTEAEAFQSINNLLVHQCFGEAGTLIPKDHSLPFRPIHHHRGVFNRRRSIFLCFSGWGEDPAFDFSSGEGDQRSPVV